MILTNLLFITLSTVAQVNPGNGIIPDEFFTFESMLTLSGATGLTLVAANSIQSAFNFNPRWLALLIAQIVSIGGVYFSKGSSSDYFIGVFNGFLIYCTASGATGIAGNATGVTKITGISKGKRRGKASATPISIDDDRRSFFSPWW